MKAIACIDENWGIGYHNNLLYHIPEDMKFFREKTKNKVIVYGRKTLETFPNKQPLIGKVNIIFSHSKDPKLNEKALIVNSVEELYNLTRKLEISNDDIIIIGGESIYNLFINLCDEVYITKVYSSEKESDKFFPCLDETDFWKKEELSEIKEYEGIKYQFFKYYK